jgi:ribosomal protein S18 acetylase RimI-like enzyme
VQVRPVRPAEFEDAGALVVAAYRALPGAHLSGDYAALLADVARRASEADVLVAVGGSDPDDDCGELLGCVTFVADRCSPWSELLEEHESGIRMLAVRPDQQRRGVGRALVDACVTRARMLGREALMLHTTPWMLAAQHLYESAGFTRVPERDWTPEPAVPLLAYRLDLRPHYAS